eukprot:4028846-Lingulodinium_polyedra.AAC.1
MCVQCTPSQPAGAAASTCNPAYASCRVMNNYTHVFIRKCTATTTAALTDNAVRTTAVNVTKTAGTATIAA